MTNASLSSNAPARRTPGLLLGPYYPLDRPADAGSTLWSGPAPIGARCLHLEGCVRSGDGTPLPEARIEMWQADPAGRYRHPSARDPTAVLDGFAGYGATRSGADGRFVFRSLVPGAYREGATLRAPHLHLQITGRHDRLVTQLFLRGDVRNGADRWFSAIVHADRLLPDVVQDDADLLALRWTAFLGRA
ncbi:MAG: hypothetical protein ABIS28_15640 [Caldimonas sp.]